MLWHLVVLSLTIFSLCGIKCYLPSLLLVGAGQPGELEELSPQFTAFSPRVQTRQCMCSELQLAAKLSLSAQSSASHPANENQSVLQLPQTVGYSHMKPFRSRRNFLIAPSLGFGVCPPLQSSPPKHPCTGKCPLREYGMPNPAFQFELSSRSTSRFYFTGIPVKL